MSASERARCCERTNCERLRITGDASAQVFEFALDLAIRGARNRGDVADLFGLGPRSDGVVRRRRYGSVRRSAVPSLTTSATTRWPHSRSSTPVTATSRTPSRVASTDSSSSGQSFSPPVLMTKPRRPRTETVPSTTSPASPVGNQSTRPSGPVTRGRGAASIGAEQCRRSHAQFTVDAGDLDARQGRTVVDDARAGLGHAPSGDHVLGDRRRRARAAEQHRGVATDVMAGQLRSHDRDVGRAPCGRGLEVHPVAPAQRGVTEYGAQENGESADVTGRETGVPDRWRAVDAKRSTGSDRRTRAQARTTSSSTALGSPLEPDVSITRPISSSTGRATGNRGDAVLIAHVPSHRVVRVPRARRRGELRRSNAERNGVVDRLANGAFEVRPELEIERRAGTSQNQTRCLGTRLD